MTDVPSEEILTSDRGLKVARERMDQLVAANLLGFCACKYFTPHATTVADIEQWVTAEEAALGSPIPVVVVDYGTLLADPAKSVKHEELTSVAEALRSYVAKAPAGKPPNRLVWTAAQVNAAGLDKKKTKRADIQHTAGSLGIPRTADLVVSVNVEDTQLVFKVAKHRHGRTGDEVGPLPPDFERGRVAPVVRDGWPF